LRHLILIIVVLNGRFVSIDHIIDTDIIITSKSVTAHYYLERFGNTRKAKDSLENLRYWRRCWETNIRKVKDSLEFKVLEPLLGNSE
jgi:hypothetical protein